VLGVDGSADNGASEPAIQAKSQSQS